MSEKADRLMDATAPSHPRDPDPSSYESTLPLPEGEVEVETRWSSRRATMGGRFLKGPIAMADIAVAAKLPGRALAVYLAARHRADLTRCTAVTLPRSLLADLGVDKSAKARALRHLEEAGLVTVARTVGRSARVTVSMMMNVDGLFMALRGTRPVSGSR